jgi:hypothetical protein
MGDIIGKAAYAKANAIDAEVTSIDERVTDIEEGGGNTLAGNIQSETFTATAGQTEFTLSDTNGSLFMVIVNNVIQTVGVGYTKTSEIKATLTSGASLNDKVTIHYFKATNVVNSTGSTNTWLSGSGTPANGSGNDGDYYFRTATGDVYLKAAGTWGSPIATIKGEKGDTGATGATGETGATGAAGATWYNGSGVPSDETGSNGDYYLRTSNSDVYFKSGGTWGSAVANIKGATGATGATGETGATGSAGADGADGTNGVYNTVTQSDSYTLALTDANTLQKCTKGTAMTVTVPANASVAFDVGVEIAIVQYGAGAVTIEAAGGVTINSDTGKLKISTQYTSATLKKIATNEWLLVGALVAA